MCGICATISNNNKTSKAQKLLMDLLMIANEDRGTDSSGVLFYDKKTHETSVKKDTTTATKYCLKYKKSNAPVMVGHTRFATLGGVSKETAHPFKFKDTYLVHNGVISNHSDIAKVYKLKYKVDSEVLLPIVQGESWDVLKSVSGSFNFIALNTKKNKLYINKRGNTLFYANLKRLGIIAINSELEPLRVATSYFEECTTGKFEENTLSIIDLNTMNTETISINYPISSLSTYYGGAGSYGHYTAWDEEPYDYGFKPKRAEDFMEDVKCINCGNDMTEDEIESADYNGGQALCFKCW